MGPDLNSKEGENEQQRRSLAKQRLESVAKLMKSAEQGDVTPTEVVIINDTDIKPYDFINFLRIQIQTYDVSLKWRMEYIANSDIIKDKTVTSTCLSLSQKANDSNYFCIFFEGQLVLKNYLSDINKAIIKRLERFLILTPKDKRGGGLFIQKRVFQQFGGDKKIDFVTKISEELESQKCQNLIQPLSKIVKGL